MKRKDENKIVIRVQKDMGILFSMYIVLFIVGVIISITTEIMNVVYISLAMVLICAVTAVVYFEKCEILQFNKETIVVKNEYGEMYNLELSQTRYKVLKNEHHILLKDNNYEILLSYSKKLLSVLQEKDILKEIN